MSDREALKARIDELSPMGVRFVTRMIDSVAHPPKARVAGPEPTWITEELDWIEYFGLMISAHHGVTVDALGLSSFESAFRSACEAANWALDPPGSPVDCGLQANHPSHGTQSPMPTRPCSWGPPVPGCLGRLRAHSRVPEPDVKRCCGRRHLVVSRATSPPGPLWAGFSLPQYTRTKGSTTILSKIAQDSS